MPRFTVCGIVPEFSGGEFSLPASNWRELLAFWKRARIATRLESSRGKPSVKVRGALAARCVPGTSVAYEIETQERADGRRIRGVGVSGQGVRG